MEHFCVGENSGHWRIIFFGCIMMAGALQPSCPEALLRLRLCDALFRKPPSSWDICGLDNLMSGLKKTANRHGIPNPNEICCITWVNSPQGPTPHH